MPSARRFGRVRANCRKPCRSRRASAGGGFTLALVLMAGLRERLDLASVPKIARGAALSLMLAGLLSLIFMGFAGLGGGE